MSQGDNVRRMVSVYDIIQRILYANESMVIVTWDTLHIILTLLIFIPLIIFIWLSKLDRYIKDEWEYKDISDPQNILVYQQYPSNSPMP